MVSSIWSNSKHTAAVNVRQYAMERLPIDIRLWTLVSGILFVALLCVDAAGCFNAERNLAQDFRRWQASGWSYGGRLENIASQSLLYAGVAFVVGWALHGIA